MAVLIIPLVALASVFSSQAQDEQVIQTKDTNVKALAITQAKPQIHTEDKILQEFYKMSPKIETIKQVCPWRSATAREIFA